MHPDELRRLFFRHVCQTSPSPLGIVVTRAEGATIWAADGRAYLDLLSGIGVANLGHGHPEVIAAVRAQAERYLHVMVYGEAVEEPQVRLARRLAELAPGDLSTAFFCSSGTEAIEGAIKLARKATRRLRLVAFRGGYHGDTMGALSLCDSPVYRPPFEPLLGDVEFLTFDDCSELTRIDERVAAVVVEPIQGEGGVRVPGADFLPALRARCDTTGALLVFDEVLTGCGRTGSWFAAQQWNVIPDVLVLAKALGGGLPLGAFVGRPELMATLSHDPPLAHVTTFGGHPLSCAAGLAALEVANRERLPERAAAVGAHWRARLEELRGPLLVDVRGRGLLIGLELSAPQHTEAFCRAAFARGLILNWTLHRDTVVRLAPPLTISDADSERALTAIAAALHDIA
ncbi:MAG TPA: aspartate aminotransferase family protein [Candidatus Dormibacteraeota bacterium]|nr:aspartate aminotransferase family protein [Candidatus Dormibacteraeota bacterium]